MELVTSIMNALVGIIVVVLGLTYRSTTSPIVEKDKGLRRATTLLIVAGIALVFWALVGLPLID